MKTETKIKKKDFYYCGRCKIDSLTKGSMCPCPRGSCEAAIIGTVIKETKTTIDKTLTEEQIKWNEENYR